MSDDAMVTAAEVARLAGVGRAAVSNWRRRHDDFPRAASGTETSPVFKLADVEQWLRQQGKLRADPAGERMWQELDAVRGEAGMADLLAVVGAFLRLLAGDPRATALLQSPDAELAAGLRDAVAAAHPELAGLLLSELDASHAPLLRAVAELAEEKGAEATFAQLCARFVEAHARQVAVTPPELAGLMVDLVGPPRGVVFDPACGTASVLDVAADYSGVDAVGQEYEESLAKLATARLAFHDARAEVHVGDSLRADAFPDLQAQAVVCNPPFNTRNWGHDELISDPRWVYGLPPRGESELAWVQHCVSHVEPGGLAVVLMPPTAALRSPGRRIRAELLRHGALRAVMALPQRSAPPLAIGLHLWVLRRPPANGSAASGLLVVDTTGGQQVKATELGWETIRERVLNAWREFDEDPDAAEERPALSRVVPIIDLLDDEVDVTPARHLQRPGGDVSGLAETRRSFDTVLGQLAELLPVVERAAGGAEHHRMTSLNELARAGVVRIQRQLGRFEVGDESDHGQPVLTAKDVITGRDPTGRLVSGDESLRIELQPGDVAVPMVAARPAARVITAPGTLLGPHLQLIRSSGDVLDPWFLAGYLCSDTAARYWSSLSGTHRIDARSVEVPLLPLGDQRAYGAAFQRLHDFEQAITATTDLGRQLASVLRDGLAAGTVRPADGKDG
ncbi:MAG: N-6 DNA methylase [Pseudonocardiaceae bacterium]|nr:N-6 DNA methylase [Pseudonocardiaceae bacterium]